jgi:exosortase
MFRPVLFAWAFLFFAWPWPFIDTTIAFPMRMVVSHLAYETLNLIGIACIQNGTALVSSANPLTGAALGSQFQIDIADPCSGIHSLLALMMFSACFSYAFLPRRWQQWTVFLSALPLVIVGNVVRILLLCIGCLLWGSAFAIGTNANPSWYHEGCGYLVFAIVLGLECLLGFFLISLDRRRTGEAKAFSDNARLAATANETGGTATVPLWRSGVVLGVAVLLGIAALLSPPLSLAPQPGVVMDLPSKVIVPELNGGGEFFGSDAQVSEVEHRLLPKDTEFSRKNYDDFNGHNIYFSIVLSGKQQYVVHPPQVCLVAQGWTITKEEDVPIKLRSGHNLVVRNLSLQRDTIGQDNSHHTINAYYMYWYVADGESTPSRGERNWLSSRDRIFKNRDLRWAYVIAMSTITQSLRPDGLNPEQTREMLADFIRQIVPFIQKSELAEGPRLGGT